MPMMMTVASVGNRELFGACAVPSPVFVMVWEV